MPQRADPIRATVRNFVEAGMFRELRKERREKRSQRPRKKAPEKTNFVRFLESLENRGPDSMSGALYMKWTQKVRKQMQEAGTWPAPEQETSIKILAEYISRLQAAFWDEFPDEKWNKVDWFSEVYRDESKFRPYRRVMRHIWIKLRTKGLRSKTFRMATWDESTPSITWVVEWMFYHKKDGEGYNVNPYSPPPPFNDHGVDI